MIFAVILFSNHVSGTALLRLFAFCLFSRLLFSFLLPQPPPPFPPWGFPILAIHPKAMKNSTGVTTPLLSVSALPWITGREE
ncbi:hypothetical protein B0H63DRAFT_306188 [Podospora didyma]|uniref:Uncharacterized protein n=1 Tax=Podospora didyma TaxID=330526 RepID=A0AAE0N427_9PEZI|nr:hypothetical protein B0H63DRAFT_306188 [Podospora didyma]